MGSLTLSPRERGHLALQFEEADRIPFDLDGWATYFTEGAYRNLLHHPGIDEEPVVNYWFLVSGVNETILQVQIQIFDKYLAIVGPYVEIVETSDDYGMQTGPLISTQLYRQMLKPAHQRLNRFIKERTNAKIYLHSCGSITDILDELIDAGVEVINPVQPRAKDMDSAGLKERFGGRVVFHGGVDEQYVLPYGSVDEVQEEVKLRIGTLAPGGGYIFAPAHNIQDDVPTENVMTMFEAALREGSYPIAIGER
jgi:uroporphyrinogen decarboxylase